MTIIADSTALILLARVSVLETFIKRNDVITSKVVYEEVVKGKEIGRSDSILVEKLVHRKNLKVKSPNNSIKNNVQKLFNLKGGELEVISLAYKTNNTILSDDKKCLNAAKALGIDYIISLDVIIVLFKKKVITKKKALKSIQELEGYGWYAKDLSQAYMEEIK
jgi:predicted nucleic acid-binding protein